MNCRRRNVLPIKPDPDYDFIPPLKPIDGIGPKGIQCGECGQKFDHYKVYGYVCGNSRCPIQLKPHF